MEDTVTKHERDADVQQWSERVRLSLESVPRWPVGERSWQLAWEMHVYILGVAFCAISFSAALNTLRVTRCRRLPYSGYLATVDLSVFLAGICRGVYLLVDPYALNGLLHPFVSSALYSAAFPLLVTAFAVLFVTLLKATHVVVFIFQNFVLVLTLAFAHLLVATLGVVPLSHLSASTATTVHLVIRVASLVWPTLTCAVFVTSAWRLHSGARRRWRQALARFSPCHFMKGETSSERLLPLYVTLVPMTRFGVAAALVALLATALKLYGTLGPMRPRLVPHSPDHWPWWALQTSMRICELLALTTVLHAASLPVRQFSVNAFSDTGSCHISCCCLGNKRRRCQGNRRRSCCCNEHADKDPHDEWYMMTSPDYFSKSTLQLHVRGEGGAYCGDEAECALTKSASLFSANKCASLISATKNNACGSTASPVKRSCSIPSVIGSLGQLTTSPAQQQSTSNERNRPVSMLTFENGLLRFRQQGDLLAVRSIDDDISLGHYPPSLGNDLLSSNASEINNSHGESPSNASVCTDWMGAVWSGTYVRPSLPAGDGCSRPSPAFTGERQRSNSVTTVSYLNAEAEDSGGWGVGTERMSTILDYHPPSDINLQDSIANALNANFGLDCDRDISVPSNEQADWSNVHSDVRLLNRRRSNSCTSEQSTRSYWWRLYTRPRHSKRWRRKQ